MTGRLLVAVALLVLVPATSARAAFAPVDAPGPALTIPAARLAASVSCTADVRRATREPVLLTPATTVDARENYGWNWIPALRAAGYPVCTSDQPGDDAKNMGDMQTRAEYVVAAIRRVHELSGRRIAVVGHSQGGMIMRWALRFWPDTRAMVEDVIGMAGTNHGSAVVPALCAVPCAPSLWQQRNDSRWTAALNSGQETFAGIDYTEIYSRVDEFVQPNLDDRGTSSLHGPGRITNVALQEICPANGSEHLLIGTVDPVAWALGADALAHDGPADPARIAAGVCEQTWMPGVDPVTGPVALAEASAQVARQLALAPRVAAEPPLRCYVTASCPAGAGAAPAARRCTTRARTVRVGPSARRVTAGGRALRIVRRGGRRVVVVRFPAGRERIVLRVMRRGHGPLRIVVRRCA